MEDESRSDAPPRRVTLSPGETVADAARKAIAFGAESLLRNQNAAEAGDVEPIHQLRVATRRLRASIELFANVIYAAQLKIFRRDIPWIAHQAGACRECDVTSALIAARAEKIGSDLSDAIAPMLAALDERRKAGHATLYDLLASKRYQGLLAKLSHPAIKKVGADRRLGVVAAQLIRPASRGASRLGEKIADDAPALVFHKLRVRIKRLRYELEDDGAARRQASSQNSGPARTIAGIARPLSRHHGRDCVAVVVCRDVGRAAPDRARGRRVDPVARQA